jgi:hypothetical protein
MLFVREGSDSQKVYLREKLVDEVEQAIMSQFDMLTSQLDAADGTRLQDSPELTTLIDTLGNPIDQMIMVRDPTFFANNANYSALFARSDLAGLVPMSAIACSPWTVTVEFPVIGGENVTSVDDWSKELLSNYGTSRPSTRSDCAEEVDCDDAPTTTKGAACMAANNFMQAKQTLMDLTTFRCDVFKDPDGGGECDIGQSRTGCISSDGTLKIKEKTCNLTEFVTYVQDYQSHIYKVFRRLDQAVEESGPTIDEKMRSSVKAFLIKPIQNVAAGVTCAFLGNTYRKLVEGLCFQGVVGFRGMAKSYVGSACLGVFMVILMCGVWRRTVDNVNARGSSTNQVYNIEQPG